VESERKALGWLDMKEYKVEDEEVRTGESREAC